MHILDSSYGLMISVVCSSESTTETTTIGKAFLITVPAVAAGSLLLNEHLTCPSTRKRNRSSAGRAWLFGLLESTSPDGLANVVRGGIATPYAVVQYSDCRSI